MEVIRELCSFEGRRAGTDAERRAANWLASRIRNSGRRAVLEPTYVHPQYGLVHALHCAVGFAGSLVAIVQPAVGFGLVLAAAVSMYLDLNGRFYLARRLFFRRASQNVVGSGKSPSAPARLFICAHYDSARPSASHGPRDWPLAYAFRSPRSESSSGPWRSCCPSWAPDWRGSTPG
jgi:hypothetical protein